MHVNKKTLLLEDLTWGEVEAIRGFKDQNRLLVLSTVMPQRILISLLRARDSFAP